MSWPFAHLAKQALPEKPRGNHKGRNLGGCRGGGGERKVLDTPREHKSTGPWPHPSPSSQKAWHAVSLGSQLT